MNTYEKKYKEALERARIWQNHLYDTNDRDYADELNYIFPELKESEDEKIRKRLIKIAKTWKDGGYACGNDDEIDNILAWLEKQGELQDKGEISDGYHTFNELYYYRMLYNAAFFNMLPKEWTHKSKRHNDGEECFGGGWFIVMANLPTGQISNHYELKDWNLFQIPEKEVADKWDGHTPQEAADRLHKYLLEKQGETFTKKDVDDAYLQGINDTKHELEKQSEQKPYGQREECLDCQFNYAGECKGFCQMKRGEQKPVYKVEPKFKVKYAGSEYNILDVKDIAGVTYYVIEDEPNHIDYVQAENCERVDGYSIKESGSPFPTKPAKFSEQKSAWSEEDELMLTSIIQTLKLTNGAAQMKIDWLKSLKDRLS